MMEKKVENCWDMAVAEFYGWLGRYNWYNYNIL